MYLSKTNKSINLYSLSVRNPFDTHSLCLFLGRSGFYYSQGINLLSIITNFVFIICNQSLLIFFLLFLNLFLYLKSINTTFISFKNIKDNDWWTFLSHIKIKYYVIRPGLKSILITQVEIKGPNKIEIINKIHIMIRDRLLTIDTRNAFCSFNGEKIIFI